MDRIGEVFDLYLNKRPDGDITLLQRAYIYSAKQHEGQLRKSGEPYLIHPIGVARLVAEMGLDEVAICAALLHDTIEDTDTTKEKIAELFGLAVAEVVDGVTKLSKINFTRKEEQQAESFRKLLVAMAKDLRVLIVKLADRLHNMRTLDHMKPESRERIAQETRDIYAPLSDRLGIHWMHTELDDLSFKYLEPQIFLELSERMEKAQKTRESFIGKTINELEDIIKKNNLNARVSGRVKSLSSIHKKMRQKHLEFEDLHDTLAFRIICKSLSQCYETIGYVHARWVPIPGRFKDFIAMPKANRYQSLHTTVVTNTGERIEIQVRTEEMHHVAEYGIAAHWAYKQGRPFDNGAEGFAWLREILDNQNDTGDAEEFLDLVKLDLFRDEVFVFTPKGDLKTLSNNATALDFAYSIHSEVGGHCTGARVNGAQVALRTVLKNGDMVEILTSKNQRPSPHWLDIAVTSRARNRIRTYLRAEQRLQSRLAGQELIEKALRRHGLSFSKLMKSGIFEKTAAYLKYGSVEDLLAAIGYGKTEIEEVLERVLPEDKNISPPAELKEGRIEKVIRRVTGSHGAIILDGLDNLLVQFARCCNPLPGEDVVGYVSHGRGIIVHQRNCPKAAILDPNRRTLVQWSTKAVSQRPVSLRLHTANRMGVLANISGVFKSLNIDITSAQCVMDDPTSGTCVFTFNVKDLAELNHLIRALKQSKDVQEVIRLNE